MPPDWPIWATKTITMRPISAFVTTGPCSAPALDRTRFAAFFAPVGCPAHSGHLIPTEANTMQSVQIGRPQLEQETAVSLRGCR